MILQVSLKEAQCMKCYNAMVTRAISLETDNCTIGYFNILHTDNVNNALSSVLPVHLHTEIIKSCMQKP